MGFRNEMHVSGAITIWMCGCHLRHCSETKMTWRNSITLILCLKFTFIYQLFSMVARVNGATFSAFSHIICGFIDGIIGVHVMYPGPVSQAMYMIWRSARWIQPIQRRMKINEVDSNQDLCGSYNREFVLFACSNLALPNVSTTYDLLNTKWRGQYSFCLEKAKSRTIEAKMMYGIRANKSVP